MLVLKARFYSWRGAMTRLGLGISPRLDHSALHLGTHGRGHQRFFGSPNPILTVRERQMQTKISQVLTAARSNLSADDNLPKDEITLYLHS